jgi:hypothetical protein
MVVARGAAAATVAEGWVGTERVGAVRVAGVMAAAMAGVARAAAAVMDAESRVVGVTVAEMREKVGMVTVVMVAVVVVAGVTARVTAGTTGVMLAETMVHSRNSRPRRQPRRR